MMQSIQPDKLFNPAEKRMKVIYDSTKDILRIVFREAPIEEFSEDRSGVTIDYDVDDRIVALEISKASKLVDNPHSTDHVVLDS